MFNIDIKKIDEYANKIILTNLFVYEFLLILSESVLWHKHIGYYGAKIIKVTFIILIVIFLYKIFRNYYNIKELAIIGFIGSILMYSYIQCKDGMLVIILIYICAIRGCDFGITLKYIVISIISSYIVVILSYFIFGLSGNLLQMRYGVQRTRFSLGFSHPAQLSYFYFTFINVFIIYKKIINRYMYILLFIVDIIFFILTDTKAPFLYTIVTLVFNIVIYNACCMCEKSNDDDKNNQVKINSSYIAKCFINFLYMLTNFLYIISVPIVYFLSYLYNENNKILFLLNKVLTGRLRLMHESLSLNKLSFFGMSVNMIKDGVRYNIDSSILYCLLNKGIVPFIISLLFILYFLYCSFKNKKYNIILSFFALIMMSTFDVGFMAIQYCPFIILFFVIFDEYKFRKQ